MLSLPKILLTLAVIAGVILATRFLRGRAVAKRGGRRKPAAAEPPDNPALDLLACASCGDYVEATAPACARADCPRART